MQMDDKNKTYIILKKLRNFELWFSSEFPCSKDYSDDLMTIYEHFLDLKHDIKDILLTTDNIKYCDQFDCCYGEFISRYNGILTDLSTLPVGSCFNVENGHWCGQIIEKNNEKYLLIHNYFNNAYPSQSEDIINKIKLTSEYPAAINMIENFPYPYENLQHNNAIEL